MVVSLSVCLVGTWNRGWERRGAVRQGRLREVVRNLLVGLWMLLEGWAVHPLVHIWRMLHFPLFPIGHCPEHGLRDHFFKCGYEPGKSVHLCVFVYISRVVWSRPSIHTLEDPLINVLRGSIQLSTDNQNSHRMPSISWFLKIEASGDPNIMFDFPFSRRNQCCEEIRKICRMYAQTKFTLRY